MSDLTPEKYRHDLEVVRNTARQVISDFQLAGVEIDFSGNPESAYRELVTQVTPALEMLYKKQRQTFMNLLYRIDVEEHKVNRLMKSTSGSSFFEGLADLVVEREFIKVLIRKLYSPPTV
jgi:hypothetical protein